MRTLSHRTDWKTSPNASSILHMLACKGPQTIKAMTIDLNMAESTARRLIKDMERDGMVHLSSWLNTLDVGGYPSKVFSLGKGKPAKKPEKQTRRQNWNRWKAKKVRMYGTSIANKMVKSAGKGGASKVVVDGKTIYERYA